MNNKGFAVTTIIYASVILLAILMLTTLEIVKNDYVDTRSYVEGINDTLTDCMSGGGCK